MQVGETEYSPGDFDIGRFGWNVFALALLPPSILLVEAVLRGQPGRVGAVAALLVALVFAVKVAYRFLSTRISN